MSTPLTPSKRDETWMEIAQTINGIEAEIIAGLLRTANIPTFIENAYGLPSTVFGQSSPGRIFVPAVFYEDALDLLDENEDNLPSLDTPSIQL